MESNPQIVALRETERRMQAASAEADRLIRGLVGVYACDFVLADVPDGVWFPLPEGWQRGLADAIVPRQGRPPRGMRGAVAVSLATLRRLAL